MIEKWREGIAERTPLLVAAVVLLAILALAGLANWWVVLLAPIGLAILSALLPAADDGGIATTAGTGGESFDASSLYLFADALPEPCLILDGRSVLIYRNAPAAQHFAGLVVGNPIALSLRAPSVLSAIDEVRRSGLPQSVELHQTVPTETWHRVTVAPLVGGHGGGHLVVTLQSLTDERRLDALRTDFIANASHELRTPLTSLLGFIDTLMGPAAKDAAAQKKFLEIMRTQAVRMSKLIEDLLSLSRIEMRQHVRPTGSVDLAGLLREVREGLQTQANEAGVDISVDAEAGPVIVTGDRDELYEVFENLIDNAIKYGSDGGKVEVALAPLHKRQGLDYVVTVTDHGPGIEAEHVPRLTERFYRVDAESSRRKKGTGLGLAIVKHTLARHRGHLAISSRPGQGTRVEVMLPR
jgi:two-component system phosphate regulon sensor histidine kinase PhoR